MTSTILMGLRRRWKSDSKVQAHWMRERENLSKTEFNLRRPPSGNAIRPFLILSGVLILHVRGF
ncbi:hypothetical protein WOLCODRAFT_29082 [Wolfiporia cocos MD-104 SS10]|uniref:Uncharacterized protein n=1 Tax=Wolfiporia cocos (strain MD-104) TaxID=742152 RepID=A0A2H3J6Y2_WOLCO|nr:hypothetical protein WOLCODRAFT_29082 [Wolfiporia cocos MD-104 SS10]